MTEFNESGKGMQLFCIPFAGGSKKAFQELASYVKNDIDVVLLEYPGHDSRRTEAFCVSIQELKEDIWKQIQEKRDRSLPFSVLGYSMGSIITYELLVDLFTETEVGDVPVHVFLCANEALSNYKPRVNFEEMTTEEIQEKLVSMGGIDERILKNERFLKVFLKPVEADYRALIRYDFKMGRMLPKVDCSIFYSESDTTYEQMQGWRNLFDGTVDYYRFEGNHFFIHTKAREMATEINRILLER